jgi:hypothetical protein
MSPPANGLSLPRAYALGSLGVVPKTPLKGRRLRRATPGYAAKYKTTISMVTRTAAPSTAMTSLVMCHFSPSSRLVLGYSTRYRTAAHKPLITSDQSEGKGPG